MMENTETVKGHDLGEHRKRTEQPSDQEDTAQERSLIRPAGFPLGWENEPSHELQNEPTGS